jgi:hypothetical protein
VAISYNQLEISDHKVAIVELSSLPSAIVDSQLDAPVAIVGSSASPVVALGLKASSVVESSEVKPPDLTVLEVGPMGAALVHSRRSVRLAAKCRGETFNLLILRRRLPGKVVSRRCMVHPMLCSSCLGLSFVATAPPGCYVMSNRFLRSACCKEVQTLHGRIGCHE